MKMRIKHIKFHGTQSSAEKDTYNIKCTLKKKRNSLKLLSKRSGEKQNKKKKNPKKQIIKII